MALRVVGSSPITHPIFSVGRRQAVRHGTLDPACEGSNPSAPAIIIILKSKYAPLAQLVEQLTLNQKVGGSTPSWRTSKNPENTGNPGVFRVSDIIFFEAV